MPNWSATSFGIEISYINRINIDVYRDQNGTNKFIAGYGPRKRSRQAGHGMLLCNLSFSNVQRLLERTEQTSFKFKYDFGSFEI